MMMRWKQVLSNGSLAVSEVYMEDSGMYGCTAKNSGGSQRAELYLQVTSSYPSDTLCYLPLYAVAFLSVGRR